MAKEKSDRFIHLAQMLLVIFTVLAFVRISNDLKNMDGLSLMMVIAFFLEWVGFILYYHFDKRQMRFFLEIGLLLLILIALTLISGSFGVLYENDNFYRTNFASIYAFAILIFSTYLLFHCLSQNKHKIR